MEQAIGGFQVANREFKIAAFADDLLFFLSNPRTSIPQLMKEFLLFGYVSNLKINYTKSEEMNVTIPDALLKEIRTDCLFRWETSALKYLGVWLTPQLS